MPRPRKFLSYLALACLPIGNAASESAPITFLNDPIFPSYSEPGDNFGAYIAAEGGQIYVGGNVADIQSSDQFTGGIFQFDAATRTETRAYRTGPSGISRSNYGLDARGDLVLTLYNVWHSGNVGLASLHDANTGAFVSSFALPDRLLGPTGNPIQYQRGMLGDDLAVLVNGAWSEVRLFDLTDPTAPRLASEIDFGADHQTQLVGDRLFGQKAPRDQGFRVYDVSNPDTPALLNGGQTLDFGPLDTYNTVDFYEGDIAFVERNPIADVGDAREFGYTDIYDIADLANPTLISTLTVSDFQSGVDGISATDDNGTFTTTDYDGTYLTALTGPSSIGDGRLHTVYLYDASDLSNIREIARYREGELPGTEGLELRGFGPGILDEGRLVITGAGSAFLAGVEPLVVQSLPGRLYIVEIPEPTYGLLPATSALLKRRRH